MKPAAFAYHHPASLEEALGMLAGMGDSAKLIAGGQSLVPVMNMRLAAPGNLIDLNGLSGLDSVSESGGFIEVGAMTRHCDLAASELVRARCPLLADAARTIGHYAIRQRGTLGGSLAHADPTAQLPLIAVTLGAHIEVASQRGRRSVDATRFFESLMTTTLAPDELVVAARFPVTVAGAGAGAGTAFRLFNRRRGDFAIVAVAATIQVADGRIVALRLGIGGVGPVPASLADLCAGFVGELAAPVTLGNIAAAVRAAITPEESARIPAEYRRDLAYALTGRALLRACEKAQGKPA